MLGLSIPQAQIYKTFSAKNIKKQLHPRNIVSAMASGGFVPVIALEACVEAGRTYQAYKRGGFDEARERITEEFSGAVFWLGGVTGLNALFEKVGQKFLHVPKPVVDIAHDDARNPLNAFLKNKKKTNSQGSEITKKFMSKYKLTKVVSSVLIANAFIGFALPKINQHITKWFHSKGFESKQNNNNKTAAAPSLNSPDMKDFIKGQDKAKEPSFGGKWDMLTIANAFENNRNVKLLSVDAGTATGRAYSARNNNERIEILFRDLSSIYFYMFCMGNMNSALNRLEQGKGHNTRLNPASADFVSKFIKENLNKDNSDIETFKKIFLGKNEELPKELKNLFGNSEAIALEFDKDGKLTGELSKYISEDKLETLKKMSELQPKMTFENSKEAIAAGQDKYIEKSVLTKSQLKDILNGGYINDPEFQKEFFKDALGSEDFLNKYKYVAQSKLDGLKKDMYSFVQSIIDEAKKTNSKEITSSIIDKMSKHNFKMNALNWGSGFVVSALFLSTLIPKMQYLITKLRTGQNAFPGTEEYREKA